MKIKSISLSDFRNIEKEKIEFSDGVNLIYGHNAQGKTNALEAIYYFARGRSFRTSRDLDLIKKEKEKFHIEILFEDKERERTLSCTIGKKERIRKKNGIKIEKISEMIGLFHAVLFCPEHLSLVKGAPEERRSFLNIAISQVYPAYIGIYASYMKLLENRNCLLKMAQKGFPIDYEEIRVFSEKMADAAAEIYSYRKRYIQKIEKHASFILSEISEGKEALSLLYESDIEEGEDIKKEYRKKLTENIQNEIGVGYSLYGIHRDDICIKINKEDARIFASQGQQRSIVLALKEAEGEVVYEVTGEYPVFLFDDVLSELDEKRQSYLLKGSDKRQIIITSCSDEDFKDIVKTSIYTEGGRYVSSHR